jgi:hypothetical protein
VFEFVVTLLTLVWRGCEATARGQIYLLMLEPAVNNIFSKKTLRLPHPYFYSQFSFIQFKNYSEITASVGATKNQKTKKSRQLLGNHIGGGSQLPDTAVKEGETGRESAARAKETEIASLKATKEAFHRQLCGILEQSNGVATGSLPLLKNVYITF